MLAKRHLEGLFARGTFEQLASYFRAAHGLLPSSLRATSEQLTSYFRAACELLRSSSRATSKQFTSYFATTHELLRSSLRVTSKQLMSHFRASPSPIRIMRLCKSFVTNGRLICNRAAAAADKLVTDEKGNSVLRRPLLPAFFCQHPLMAALDMHGELCTWRLFTLRGHSGSADAPPRLPMERC